MKNIVTLFCLLLLCTPSFAEKKVIPGQPVLVLPANGQSDYADGFFTWKAATDTQGSNITYDFYLAETNPANIILQQNGIDENFVNDDMIAFLVGDDFSVLLIQPLSANKTYYWKVAASNALGETTESAVYSFNTGNVNIYPPTAPENPSPASLATDISRLPALTWQKSSDADGDSVSYNLYLDTAPRPARLVAADLASNRFQVTSPLIGNTKYYWQVIAADGRGLTQPGPVWSFTTANTPPPVAALVSPLAGETSVDPHVILSWLPASDPDLEAVQYEVWYGTTPTPAVVITTNDVQVPLNVTGGATYYWYVVTIDSHGARSASPVRSFTTRTTAGNHEPSVVVLSVPADASNNITLPQLEWDPSTDGDGDALMYTVYLGRSQTAFKPVATGLKTTTFRPSGLEPGRKYYWYVEAVDGKGGVSASAVWTFTTTADDIGLTNIGAYFRYPHQTSLYEFSNVTLAPAFAVDSLTYTAKGRTTVTDAVALALFYKNAGTTVTIDVPPGFTATKNIIYDLGLPTNAQAIYQIEGPLDPGTTIQAVVHLKFGVAERTYVFMIRVNTPPAKAILSTPVDKEENVNLQPVFTWQAGDDTDGTAVISRIFIGTSPTGMSTFLVPANTKRYAYNGKALLSGVKYYWKVTVQDSQGETAESDTYTFITKKSTILSAPVLTYPRAITTYADTDFDLEWQYDPAKAATYDVYLDVQSTPAKIADGVTGAKYAVHNLANNTTYYWKIVAHHADGTTAQSAVQKFRTKPGSANPTGTFIDSRDGQRYQWVELGGRKWMVHNLAYQPNPADGYAGYEYYFDAVSGNKEYFIMDSNPDNLAKYGYQYNWTGALNGDEVKPVNLPRRGVCPAGWHIPTRQEWNDAYIAANGVAGDAALANNTIYFDTWSVPGKQTEWLNTFGLSVLPSGSKLGTVITRINQGQFWLAERDNSGAYGVRYSYNTTGSVLIITDDLTIDPTTGGSSVRCVKNINDAPQKPVLTTPANNSAGAGFAPKLQWSASADPDGDVVQYIVYVDTAASPVKLEADSLTANNYSLTGLAQSTKYYWKVVARDANGLTTESDVWSFTTKANSANTAPDRPQLLQPADQSTISTRTPTLTWKPLADTNTGDVVTADVYIGTAAADMKRIVSGFSGTSYTLTTPLASGLTYYWKVVANDGNGGVTSSVANRFSTGNQAPGAPVLLSPPVSSQSTLTQHVLSWTKSIDPEGDPVKYTVYTGRNVNNLTPYAVGITATDTLFSDFNNPLNTTYYWKVVASDGKGGETASPVFNFRTYSFNDLGVVTLLSPASGATQVDLNPVLSWNGSAGRTYDIYLNEGKGPVLIARELTTTSYTVTGLHGNSRLEPHTGYSWQVVSKTTSGTVTISATRGFTTRSTAPPKPVLIAPSDAKTDLPYTATVLQWNKGTDADNDRLFYDVVLDAATSPTTIIATNVLDTAFTVPAYVLKPNKTYYWKIIAHDAFGGVAQSNVWRFTTIMASNTAPSAPLLISPAQYASGVDLQPVLTWDAGHDAEGDAISYDVYFDKVNTLNIAKASGITSTTHTVSAPLSGHTTYYWKVIAVDANTAKTSSVVGSFTTLNRAPLVPVLVSPADSTVLTTATTTLKWNTVTDPDGDAVLYDVYLDKADNPATKVAQGLTVASFTTAVLDNNTLYHWKVVARDAFGTETQSKVYTLQGGNLPPPAAILKSPVNNGVVSTANALLSWQPVTDPDGGEVHYEIVMDEQPAPSQKLGTIYNSISFGTSALVANHTYYWKIITKDTYGEASESAVWKFTYQPGAANQPPTAPVLVAPADRSTDVDGSALLTWNGSVDPEGDAITYAIYASTDPAALVQRVSDLSATSFLLTALNPGETWYWKVTATDDHSNVVSSDTWQFTTLISQPSTYVVSGRIIDGTQQPVAGISIEGFPVAVVTNANGNYSVNVPAGWSGQVAPVSADRTFTPSSRDYSNITADIEGHDYVATLINGIETEPPVSLSVYPNPSGGSAHLLLDRKLMHGGRLVLTNSHGQDIAQLAIAPGQREVVWDGTDGSGNAVRQGMYYAQLYSDKRLLTVVKIVIIK